MQKVNKRTDSSILKALFISFLKIGAFTFGGGYAMIPLIKREIVEEKKWLNDEEMLDIVAVAESTPGPLAVNAATFVGCRVAGTEGALAATTGVVLPAFVIMIVISKILSWVEQAQVVKFAFNGIRAGVLVLIVSALLSLFRQSKKEAFNYIVMFAAFIAAAFFHVSTILILICCAVLGYVRLLCRKEEAK